MVALDNSILAEEVVEVASTLVVEEVKEEVVEVVTVILVADKAVVAAGTTTVSQNTTMMAQEHPVSKPGATQAMLLPTKDKVEAKIPNLQVVTRLHSPTKVAVATKCTLLINTTPPPGLMLTEQKVDSLIYKTISEFVWAHMLMLY